MKNSKVYKMTLSPLIGLLVICLVGALNVAAQTIPVPLAPPRPRRSSGVYRQGGGVSTCTQLYSFKRDALIQSIGMGGQVIGEYHRVSKFTFDDQGNRYEKINFFPMSSMPEVTPEDIDDLGGVEPFALEPRRSTNTTFVMWEKKRSMN